ncbi:MAG: hypothetical protein ACKPKO_03660, partial [Candidatus Fonsibacter sp.]
MGQYLIDNIHHVTIDGCVLRAEWTTDSNPNIVMNSIRLTTTNHPSLWLYYHADHGLVQVWDYVNQVEIFSDEWGLPRLPRHHPYGDVPPAPTTTSRTRSPPWVVGSSSTDTF